MAKLVRDDCRFIRAKTCGNINRQGKMLTKLWDDTGRKGRKMTIAPGIVFIRAK